MGIEGMDSHVVKMVPVPVVNIGERFPDLSVCQFEGTNSRKYAKKVPDFNF